MEFKYLLILCALGVAAGFTVPMQEQRNPELRKDNASPLDLEASFPQSSSDLDSSSELPRNKRGLLEKLFKDHDQSEEVFVNRRYENSGDIYRPGREVHHHHYEQPAYQPYYPAPNQQYHHYHGYQQQQQGQGYYPGGQQNYYGNGGWNANNGGYNTPAPTSPPQQEQAPISAAPLSSGQNTVDRGQGAAAVNNIAIIHARTGSSTHNLGPSERQALPPNLPVDVNNLFNH